MVLKDDSIIDGPVVLRPEGAEEDLSKMCSKKGVESVRAVFTPDLNVKRRNDFAKGKMTNGHGQGRIARTGEVKKGDLRAA